MSNTKTILVTGGAGFIGSNLCDFLINKEITIVCLDNLDNFYSEEIKKNNIKHLIKNPLFKLIKGDVRNKVLLEEIFLKNKIDFVIHLAAKAGVRNSISTPIDYFDVNVNGTLILLEAMKSYGVKNLIFASSSSVYGNKNGNQNETESCNEQISPYAVSKKAAELLNYSYYVNFNINVINLRMFSVYGKNQRPDLVIHKFINQISKNEPIEIYGNIDTTRDYTHIDDIMSAFNSSIEFLKTSERNVYETINIGSSNPISLRQLIGIIEKTIKPQNIKIIENKFIKGEVTNTHADLNKAKKILNYKPTVSIEDGIKKFYNWYKLKK